VSELPGAERQRGAPRARAVDGARSPPAQVVVLVPPERMRTWVLRLAEVLERQASVPVRLIRAPWPAESTAGLPSEVLEPLLSRGRRAGHADWASSTALPSPDEIDWARTLVVNLTERDPHDFPPPLRTGLTLTPIFHGARRSEALAWPLLHGEAPHVAVVLSGADRVELLHAARLAAPERFRMRQALDLIFGRTITLIASAAAHVLDERPLPKPAPPPRPARELDALGFWWSLAGVAAPKIARAVSAPFLRHDWWCVGIRPLRADSSPIELDLATESFQLLDAGPDRFYADPFLLRHQGVTALFVEDYDYRRRKAVISGFTIDAAGRVGKPFTALNAAGHLSYPFVFSVGGQAFMVPESSANRTVELYEAVDFPEGWRQRAVLLEDIDASDTTLHFDVQTGLWWMFSAVAEPGGSSHDTLSIFYSERLEGPWRPHRANPVKLGPAGSRPAGPLLPWNGRLFRPAQDCTHAYGEGLVWCEVTSLTPEVFSERTVARNTPRAGFAGLHTYGRAAGYEVVDVQRPRPRLARLS